ncbi:MAG: YggT family protein [Anaerolineales bacterium]|nr:YggT family protein [Anaerolineales bacterium]
MIGLIKAIQLASNLATLVLLADIIVKYFLDPFHPVRAALDSIVNPFLNPIRKILPSTGMADFSPIVLWLLIQVVERILVQILLPIA